jgi:putative N6-adenine-specific DNA methylase
VDRWGLPVDLEGHDLEIVVRAEWKEGWVAGRLHRESLRRRPWGLRLHWAAVNPVIAYGMVRLGEPRPGERVHDPFCGSGTIPIEGALVEPEARWSGSDWDGSALFMTAENARAAGVELSLARGDAMRLPFARDSVDLVLGNLPFGRRSGSHRKNRHLYRAFLGGLARVLRGGGRAVLLTIERRLMLELLEGLPLELLDDRVLTHGGLSPRLYTLRRTG